MKSMSTPSISVMNCVEPRFHLAPVVIRGPITREFLDRRELHALRFVRDSFSLRLASALMRLRNSVSLALGTFRWNGWIAVFSLPFGCATALMDELSSARTKLGRPNVLTAAVAAAASTRRRRFIPGGVFCMTASSVTGVAGFEVRGAKAHVLRGITAGHVVRFYWTMAGVG
jgi:hypothetical protein